ncbi:hypothetical protein Tsubulata_048474 [Turnera subulata]|uniref:DUF4283 domain-containing protein n=1 Tax=Turnera subulata TaxID=218843 RepID=A0A9Q0JPA5_9ROSI|nr:hypothetical protein Tsubulata_048474 [Turnera subulata]
MRVVVEDTLRGAGGSQWPLKPPDPTNQAPTSGGAGTRPSFKDKLMQWRAGETPHAADDGFKLSEGRRLMALRFDSLIDSNLIWHGYYLTVQSWAPGFDVSKDPTRTIVWVQIPKLPAEWYRKDLLNVLAEQIGKPVRNDVNTLEAERAKFARLAIEVDFTEPLLGWIEIEGRWYKVCYEDIPDLCFRCGTIRHTTIECTSEKTVPAAPPPPSMAAIMME